MQESFVNSREDKTLVLDSSDNLSAGRGGRDGRTSEMFLFSTNPALCIRGQAIIIKDHFAKVAHPGVVTRMIMTRIV